MPRPIKSKGKTVGCMDIISFGRNAFNKEEMNPLETMAQQIKIAINEAPHAEAPRKVHDELEFRVRECKDELEKVNEALQVV